MSTPGTITANAAGFPNQATTESPLNYFYYRTWNLVVCICIFTLGFYVTSMLIVYQVRVGKVRGNKTDPWVAWMRHLCLIGSVTLLTRVGLEFVEIQLGETESLACQIGRPLKATLYALFISCVYLVLWMRQRKFYQLPAMKHLSSKPIRILSALIVFVMAAVGMLSVSFYIGSRRYTNSPRSCVLLWSSVWTKYPGIWIFLFSLIFQSILLGLLVYPLVKHRKSNLAQSRSQKREIALIRRVTVGAVLTVSTDGLCGIITLFISSDRYGPIRSLVYDCGMLLSLLLVIATFVDWKERLCPCLIPKHENSSQPETTNNLPTSVV